MSSDGLFDVLRDSDIERVVNSHNPQDLQGIADELLALTTKCKTYSHTLHFLQVVSDKTEKKFYFQAYFVTNRDDILVMVCRVEMKKDFM